MAARGIWTDRQMLDVMAAETLCRRQAPLSAKWIQAVADYALVVEGVERTGWRRRLTVTMARRRVLQLARRMGHSSYWTRRQLEGLGGK